MSSIGSIGGTSGSWGQATAMRPPRPDPAQMAEQLFAKLDTDGQGYFEVADLESAYETANLAGNGLTSSELFAQLDADTDGKVTASEFSTAITSLAAELDAQFAQGRMDAARMGGGPGMGGMPPPPPPPDDEGYTEEELATQLASIDSADDPRAALLTSLVDNFAAADTDGDGKISFAEAMSFDAASATSDDTATTSSSTTETNTSAATTSDTESSGTATTDARFMLQIMQLMHAYGLTERTAAATTLATTA